MEAHRRAVLRQAGYHPNPRTFKCVIISPVSFSTSPYDSLQDLPLRIHIAGMHLGMHLCWNIGIDRGKGRKTVSRAGARRLGQLSSPDALAPVRHLRTPSQVRHLRTPIILTAWVFTSYQHHQYCGGSSRIAVAAMGNHLRKLMMWSLGIFYV